MIPFYSVCIFTMIQYTIEQLSQAIKSSFSWAQVLKQLGFKGSGPRKRIYKDAKDNNLDFSHFTGQLWSKGKKLEPQTDIQIYLNNEQKIGTHALKQKLFTWGLKENKCEKCELTEWLGNIIKVELHHIDGNRQNNNLNNLQLLCPNCHSFTDNFRGSNQKRKNKTRIFVTEQQIIEAIKNSFCRREALLKLGLCGYGGNYERINTIIEKYNLIFQPKPKTQNELKREEEINKIKEKYNDPDYIPKKNKSDDPEWKKKPKYDQRKVMRPTKEELIKMIYDKPMTTIGKELGVSDNSIRNWMKWYHMETPDFPKGYWAKVRHGMSKIPCPI